MARYTNDGQKIPTEIWEAAMMGTPIKVTCTVPACEHSAVFHPAGLWYLFARRGWQQTFYQAQARFWCRRCTKAVGLKVKRAYMTLSRDAITDDTLPLPSDREWKRFVSRHRG